MIQERHFILEILPLYKHTFFYLIRLINKLDKKNMYHETLQSLSLASAK
jgi:hypothetical protein